MYVLFCSTDGGSNWFLMKPRLLNTDVFVSLAYYNGNRYDSDVSLSAILFSPSQHVRYYSNQLFSMLTVVYVTLVRQAQMMTKGLGIVALRRKLKTLPTYAYRLTD